MDPFKKISHNYTFSIQEDHLHVECGPHIEEQDDDSPPFYITLNAHNRFLHNYMLDLGASHNLMPNYVIMEVGLDITKPYHDPYTFDSRRVRCLGLIKYLVLSLT